METEKEYRVKFARSGGIARAKKLSKMRKREIAVEAANARWAKKNGKGKR